MKHREQVPVDTADNDAAQIKAAYQFISLIRGSVGWQDWSWHRPVGITVKAEIAVRLHCPAVDKVRTEKVYNCAALS